MTIVLLVHNNAMRITWFKPYKNLVHVVEIYTNIHLVFYWRLYCGYLWVNQVVINEPRRGQNLPYARDQFLPIWRSVLKARFITRVYPSYIPKKELPYILDDRNREQPNNRRSSQIRVGLLGLLERSFPKVASMMLGGLRTPPPQDRQALLVAQW
jgi:hypothetical protein